MQHSSLWAKYDIIIGVDEAGRGALAGPVVAAAVALPSSFSNPQFKDSKKLPTKKREELYNVIHSQALATAIAEASPQEINTYNILQATFLAMHRSLNEIVHKFKNFIIIVDGSYFKPFQNFPYLCIPDADEKICAVSAASIIAKVFRDRKMKELALQYPYYAWEKNKGYYDSAHIQGIIKHGFSPLHRNFKIKNLFSPILFPPK